MLAPRWVPEVVADIRGKRAVIANHSYSCLVSMLKVPFGIPASSYCSVPDMSAKEGRSSSSLRDSNHMRRMEAQTKVRLCLLDCSELWAKAAKLVTTSYEHRAA